VTVLKWGARIGIVAGGLVATRVFFAGCDDSDGHIYTGEPYYPAQQCMLPLTAVDVVTGAEPLNPCAAVCIVSPPEDGGITAYISTMCPPLPQYPNVIADGGTSPLCAAAFAAYNRDALCEDGGVVYPLGEDSGTDSGPDAGSDASDATAPQQDSGSSSDAGDAGDAE
jgi:hypothetical protein